MTYSKHSSRTSEEIEARLREAAAKHSLEFFTSTI